MTLGASSAQVRTLDQMVADEPDVDVRDTWTACWSILTDIKERLVSELGPVTRHPSSEGYDYYQAGDFEGCLTTWTGPRVEWFVHSWIGNRKASILDMNINIWMGQETDAPHLAIVFGTVPQLFHYSDLLPRRDLTVSPEYLEHWYEPENAAWLALRGDDRFTWSVSHGSYMRAILSPLANSYTCERSPEMVEVLREQVIGRFERWLEKVKNAAPVAEADRPALRARDHLQRTLCYTLDPMNALAEKFMGADTVRTMVDLRHGAEQIRESDGR